MMCHDMREVHVQHLVK